MASRLGPLYSLHAVARKDWTSNLQNETQVVVESGQQAFVIEVLSESFRNKLLASGEAQWIFFGQLLREDEEILYAFENPKERTLFEELRSIDGIGPKSAALLVGKLGLSGFREVIQNPKSISTVKVSGLGPKNLEKISLGLKQKKEHFLGIVGIQVGSESTATTTDFDFGSDRQDLEKALIQLGVKPIEARELFSKMCKENPDFIEMPLTQLLQEALKWWGKARSPSSGLKEKSL
ncbi:MAG: Holliday junction branch migration protein RuvA [Bdellovibrionota bacterium]